MNDYRIILKTKDGHLIMNRRGTKACFEDKGKVYPDKTYPGPARADGMSFTEYSLRIDCRERGVKLISWIQSPSGVEALVDWL